MPGKIFTHCLHHYANKNKTNNNHCQNYDSTVHINSPLTLLDSYLDKYF